MDDRLGGDHGSIPEWNHIFFIMESLVTLKAYSRVWNKRTPLNKRSPLENLAKRIIVAPFLPYTMKSRIRP